MRVNFLIAGMFAFWVFPVRGSDPCDIYSRYQNDPVLMTIVSLWGIETQSYQEKRCRLEQEANMRYLSADGLYLSSLESDGMYRPKVDKFTSYITSDLGDSNGSLDFEVITDLGKPPKNKAFETGKGFTSSGVLSD